MRLNVRSLVYLIAIYVAFFASGAACLVAEVTWNRMLIVVVGNSLSATALIVAVFMGGLGLGSYVGGRVFSTRRSSLLPYLVLECCIGVYVLLSPVLFGLFSDVFASLAGSGVDRVTLTVIRLVVTVAALLLPAFLMGATFPAIISGTAHTSPARQTARTGYLYSVNTLGAAVGCYAAGYHLLFEYGVTMTLTLAFGLYALAATAAVIANALGVTPTADEPAAAAGESVAAGAAQRRYLVVATFAIGFVALAYQVLLTRLGILFLGNSVSVFALVLTGFLLGTGISAVVGTWAYDALQRRTAHADRLFGALAALAGVAVFCVPFLLLSDWMASPDLLARHADAGGNSPLGVLAVIIAPTVLLGGLLPIAIRMLQPEGRAATTSGAATLYALNTGGAVLGALLANHYLVPLIGMQGVLVVLFAICVGVGLVGLLRPGASPVRWTSVGVAVVAATIAVATSAPNLMYRYGEQVAASTLANKAEVRLIVEGRAATVTVVDQEDPSRGTFRDMYLNGVEEASTRFWHTQLFKLLGIYPVLVHESDQPKEVLVIAFGAGITAGSTLASDEVGSLDVVDLNPDIEGINNLFTDVNGNVFHQPRFHFHNDDGRNYLVTSGKRYDVIVNDSTHPRAYDSWILYTREFYEAVKQRLAPGGVFAQWVPVLGSMQGDLFKIHLNTFRSVFPNTTFWYVYGSDQAFLLATPEPLAIDAERLQAKLDRLPAWFRADHYQLDTVARIAGFFWLDGPALARMIGDERRINTDDVHYFDKQAAVRPAPPEQRLPVFQADAVPLLRHEDLLLADAIRRQQAVAQGLARYAFFGHREQLLHAFCLLPEDGNVGYWMDRAYASQPPKHASYCDEQVRQYVALAKQHPDNARVLNGLAHSLAEVGEYDQALEAARRALAIEPKSAMVLDTYGWILFKQNKLGPAMAALHQAREAAPDQPEVLYHLGEVYRAVGEAETARSLYERALALESDFPGADDARSYVGQN